MGITITIPSADFSANGLAPLREDVSAYRAALGAIPSTITGAKIIALNTLLTTLENAGVFAKLDQIYTFNGSNLAGALKKVKGSGGDLAVSGSPNPAWSASGLTIDGNEGILTTGYTLPATSAISWYCGTNTLAALTVPVSGGASHEIAINSSGQIQGGIGNLGGTNLAVATDANKIGLWTVTRDSATSLKLYKGAVQVAENTTNVAAGVGSAVQIGARSGLASAQIPHLTRFVALWNTSASAADIAALNTALNTYLAVS
jgi:hypothetical protein